MEQEENAPDIIEEILSAFERFDGSYRREEVNLAVELQEEITPHLLEILERVLQSPATFADNEDRFDHIYALTLLGFFRETKAHALLVRIASLPHDLLYGLFGDMVTEDFDYLLLETCGGDFSHIEALLRNRETSDYVRGAAAEALVLGVVTDAVSLDDVLPILMSVFDEWKQEKEFRACYQFIASQMLTLHSVAVAEKVREALEHGMIASLFLNESSIEESLNSPRLRMGVSQKRLSRRENAGVHGRIGWWHCFKKKECMLSPGGVLPRKPAEAKKAKQNKRKAQKQSRRKNRR
jgi:hypothetical protein